MMQARRPTKAQKRDEDANKLCWCRNHETGEWELWVRNAAGEWEQVQQSDDAAQVAVPEPKWFKNRETGEWEQWVENLETGQWEQLQQADELVPAEVDGDVQETAGDASECQASWEEQADANAAEVDGRVPETAADTSAWCQGTWEEQVDDSAADDVSEALPREAHARDVYADDDEESGALEVFATSIASASVCSDARLQSFLASVGPEFDVLFVAQHTGASSYDDLITFIEAKEDLDALVKEGMTPLQRNKLFRAIQKEREQPAH